MKKLFFLLTTFFSIQSMALEKVDCHDELNHWSVSYKLDGGSVIDLSFISNSVLVKQFPGALEANVTHILRKTFYETSLGAFAYFDFERRKMNPFFKGEFMLQNSPVGLETSVTCVANPI